MRAGARAIARAIENEPSVDESTRNRDTKTGANILAMPEGMQDEVRTIVMVTYSEEDPVLCNSRLSPG